MRQVFTSPRIENVERVAAFLREHDVDARITNGRSYRGARRGTFSYRETANENPHPAVWIVKSEDQPRARELLRGMGLLDSGRSPTSYLPTSLVGAGQDDARDAARRRAFRIKAGLLVGIVMALGLAVLALRAPTPRTAAAPAVAPAAVAPAVPTPAAAPTMETQLPQAYAAATPTALAALLLDAELRAHAGAACVSVDGGDASDGVRAQLRPADGARLRPRADCDAAGTGAPLSIGIDDYRTDGSGTGTVRVAIASVGRDGRPRTQTRTLQVQRDDLAWRVRRVVE